MRISSFLGIAFEVVAKLLDRTKLVLGPVVVNNAVPREPITQVVVQLDLEPSVLEDDRLAQEQHMAYRTIPGEA